MTNSTQKQTTSLSPDLPRMKWSPGGWVRDADTDHEGQPPPPSHTENGSSSEPAHRLKWTPGGWIKEPNTQQTRESASDDSSAKDLLPSVPDPETLTKAISNTIALPGADEKYGPVYVPEQSAPEEIQAGQGNVPNQWEEPPPPVHVAALPGEKGSAGDNDETAQGTVPVQWEEAPEPKNAAALSKRPERKPMVFTAEDAEQDMSESQQPLKSPEDMPMPAQWEEPPGAPVAASLPEKPKRQPLVFTEGDMDGKLVDVAEAEKTSTSSQAEDPAKPADRMEDVPVTEISATTPTSQSTPSKVQDRIARSNATSRAETSTSSRTAGSSVRKERREHVFEGRGRDDKDRGLFGRIRHSLRKKAGAD